MIFNSLLSTSMKSNSQLVNPIIRFALLFVLCFTSCNKLADHKNHQKKIKIACIGDSITYGMGIKNREKNAYPSQLGKILGDGYEVKNFGVSGCTMLKNGDLPYWTEQAYREAQHYNPDVVVIELGTNDSKFYNWKHHNEFIPDYSEMIHAFRNLPACPKVYVCFPSPLYYTGENISDSVITRQVIPKIDSISDIFSIDVIDLYHPLCNQPQHFPDGIHPNADGAGIIARSVARLLTYN